MESNMIIQISIITIASLAISLTLTQLILRKARQRSAIEGRTLLSYAILFFSWVIVFTMINVRSLQVINEYLDNIYKTKTPASLADIVRTTIIFVGLANVWLIVCHLMSRTFSMVIMGQRDRVVEMDNDNYAFFLMNGALFVSVAYCLMPVFEMIVRLFFPTIEIPYYR